MLSVSTRTPVQEVREISVKSGKIRKKSGKMKVEKRGHPVEFGIAEVQAVALEIKSLVLQAVYACYAASQ